MKSPFLFSLLLLAVVMSSCSQRNVPTPVYTGPLDGTGWTYEEKRADGRYFYYTFCFTSEKEARAEVYVTSHPLNLEAGDNPYLENEERYIVDWAVGRVLNRDDRTLTMEFTRYFDGFAGVSELEPDTVVGTFDDESHISLPLLVNSAPSRNHTYQYTRFDFDGFRIWNCWYGCTTVPTSVQMSPYVASYFLATSMRLPCDFPTCGAYRM